MPAKIRKIIVQTDEVRVEMGREVHPPARKALAMAVIENPCAGRYVENLDELVTVAKYWRQWADPRFVVLVVNNRDLSFVSWEQRSGEGTPRYAESQPVPDVAYHEWARVLGLDGIFVERPEQIDDAWDRALRADRPTVINALVDPAELMVPPHFTYEQARNTAAAVLRGDADWAGIIRRGMPTMARTLLGSRPS